VITCTNKARKCFKCFFFYQSMNLGLDLMNQQFYSKLLNSRRNSSCKMCTNSVTVNAYLVTRSSVTFHQLLVEETFTQTFMNIKISNILHHSCGHFQFYTANAVLSTVDIYLFS